MRGLSEKTILVTGSGRGIGRAIAGRLATEGATVAINDVDADAATDAVTAIETEGGDAVRAVADVSDLEAVREMVTSIVESEGGIHGLVNNAGWDRIEWFLEQDPARWDRIIDINFRGQLNCSRAVGEHMVDQDIPGTFVNIASDAGRVGSSGEAVYAGTKGGVIAFTKTLARELARYGINCNVIAPGPADTPLTRDMREESELAEKILGAMQNQIPLGRMTEPEDIAAMAAFLASDDASFVTGQVISVSGGLTMVG